MSSGYQRVMPLSRGGMASVELVLRQSRTFTQLFARKRPHAFLMEEPAYRAMFLEEARIAALVNHPNVVSVIDSGEDDEGPFLIMEFVQGFSVSQLLRHCGQALPVSLALRIAGDAAAGLHAIHELVDREGNLVRLIHRDVSPQNLLVDVNGTTKVADFGIAKALGDKLAGTATALLRGKPGYWSPEQLRLTKLDRRSDLFALGIVLFELLAGRRLFGGTPEESARRVLEEPPPDLGELRDDVPDEVEELLYELLAKNVELRPATAAIVRERIEASLAALTVEPQRLDRFLETCAGETITERRQAIQEAVGKALSSSTAAATPAPASEPSLAAVSEPLENAGPPTPITRATPRPRTLLGATAIVLVAAVGGALGYHLLPREHAAPAFAGDGPASASRDRSASPALTVEAEPRPSPPAANLSAAIDAGLEAAAEPEAPGTKRRPRQRGDRRPAADRAGSSRPPAGIPWWDRSH